MTKQDPIQYLDSLQSRGWDLGLSRISTLLQHMQNPQQRFKSVHVAGTNGKGTTCAVLESIMRQSGYRTGLFTSPHLQYIGERIRVNGEPIPETELGRLIVDARPLIEQLKCTYFEAITAIALQYFAGQEVEIAVIEVGLGGRFDATNVITPELSVITSIDFDHTEHLGSSLTKIAREKSAIMKPGVLCLTSTQQPAANTEIRRAADTIGIRLVAVDEICKLENITTTEDNSTFDLRLARAERCGVSLPLSGSVQVKNAALAIAAAELLHQSHFEVPVPAILSGLAGVHWPGRHQKLAQQPKIVIDVAHNASAFREMTQSLRRIYTCDRLIFILGLLHDKNATEIAATVAGCADSVHLVTPDCARARPAKFLAEQFRLNSKEAVVHKHTVEAFATTLAEAGKHDLICVTGSHYVVGEFLDYFQKKDQKP